VSLAAGRFDELAELRKEIRRGGGGRGTSDRRAAEQRELGTSAEMLADDLSSLVIWARGRKVVSDPYCAGSAVAKW
jgi:hypothetical protein